MDEDRSTQQRQRTAVFLNDLAQWATAEPTLAVNDAESFVGVIRLRADELAASCAAFLVDAPSADIVDQIAVVAAAQEALIARGLDAESASQALIDALARWVRENAPAYSLARLGISRESPELAFSSARENFKRRGEERFGSHFRYEQEVSTEDESFVSITKCLYHDLGQFLGKPEVVPVFCAMDTIWAEHATRPPFNISFERPTTLAGGSDRCRFQFSRRK